jgi:hypothetical protein
VTSKIEVIAWKELDTNMIIQSKYNVLIQASGAQRHWWPCKPRSVTPTRISKSASYLKLPSPIVHYYVQFHRIESRISRNDSSLNGKMVKTLPFGSLQVPSPGFGAMGLSFGLGSNLSLEEAEPVLLKAIELGCTFWDTAVSHLIDQAKKHGF